VAKPVRHQKIIGEAIRRFRKQVGLSQEELAEKADLHPVYVGELERGEEAASVFALLRIAKALKVKVRDLVSELCRSLEDVRKSEQCGVSHLPKKCVPPET
jgi:transcriptional regulator with XRE-family HTH domain